MEYWTVESLGLEVGDQIEWGETPREVQYEDGRVEIDIPPHSRGKVIAVHEGFPPAKDYSETVDPALLAWAEVKFENGATIRLDTTMDWAKLSEGV